MRNQKPKYKPFLRTNRTGMLILGLIGIIGLCEVNAQKAKKPNIIYILTDQQSGNAMSNMGNRDLETPAMDGLAEDGVTYARAYTSFPICSPARASMLTGLMPHQTGNNANNIPIPDTIKSETLPFFLKDNGYKTYYGGKWHLVSYNIKEGNGFDEFTDFGDNDLADSAIAYIKQRHEQPFFMMLSFDEPHGICEFARNQPMPWGEIEIPKDERKLPSLPYNFGVPPYEPDIIRNYQRARPHVFPTHAYTPDDWRKYRYVYHRLVERVDIQIGRVIEALKEEGLYDDAVLIFSSDHGDGQGAHHWNQKTILYEESIHVPFIVKLPKKKHAGKRISMPVSASLDLYPTIAAVIDAEPPKSLMGENALEWVESKKGKRSPVFVETVMDVPDIIQRRKYYGYAIITENYKYVNYSQGKYREQLFDLETDPGEMINLALEGKYDTVLDDFRTRLVDWVRATNAPGIRRLAYNNSNLVEIWPWLFKK